jgi:Pretoxin HINT domain
LGGLTDLGTTPDTTANGLPAVDTLPDGSTVTTTPQTNPDTGEVVLPETITGVNPLDVAAPEVGDVPVDSTVPAGDVPVDVAPPGEVTPPSLGNTPSDGLLDIAPPESLEASVPPIDNVPSPLDVAPPEGWMPDAESSVGVLETGNIDVVCIDLQGSNGTYNRCFRVPSDLTEEEQRQHAQIQATTGGSGLDDEETLGVLKDRLNNLRTQFEGEGSTLDAAHADKLYNLLKTYLDDQWLNIKPEKRGDFTRTLINIAIGIQVGNITNQDIDEMAGNVSNGLGPAAFMNSFVGQMDVTEGLARILAIQELEARSLGYNSSTELLSDELFGNAHQLDWMLFGAWVTAHALLDMATGKAASLISEGGMATRVRAFTAEGINPRYAGTRQRVMDCFNSFSPDTLVNTKKGLIAISALTAGSLALAYNETTGENEYQPILEIIENEDSEITYLSLRDDESLRYEMIVTTPGHPFYLEENVDSTDRPAPKGHEDLNKPWVGAGDLKIGDRIRQADGTMGTVKIVKTVEQTMTMYNLNIDIAHTYYVGKAQWLVHNCEVKFKRWKVGEAIDKPMSDGSIPDWDVVRSRYWKNRYDAAQNSGQFSQANLDRMRNGNSPLDYNPRTGAWESRELHHNNPQRNPGPYTNNPINLYEVTPDQHRAIDPYRW